MPLPKAPEKNQSAKVQGEPGDRVLERLHKFLARAGICSRRQAEKLIEAGRVRVDGQAVATPGALIDPEKAEITVDGKKVARPGRRRTLMLHKPAGYVTTMADPQGRRTITELVSSQAERLFPIGRLDYDATGLLLLTNDGELAQGLMHPRFKVPKTYRVTVVGQFSPEARQRLQAGIDLDGRPAVAEKVRVLKTTPDRSVLELTIREGRYHQVKRMCAQVGHPVLKLKRLAYGPLHLGHLPSGAWRELDPAEVQLLKQAAGLSR